MCTQLVIYVSLDLICIEIENKVCDCDLFVYAEDMKDLDDFIRWVELHAKEFTDSKAGRVVSGKEGKQLSRGSADDLKKLQHEYDKLASKKKTEISALLGQKQFVWNQYNLSLSFHTDGLNQYRHAHQ